MREWLVVEIGEKRWRYIPLLRSFVIFEILEALVVVRGLMWVLLRRKGGGVVCSVSKLISVSHSVHHTSIHG